MDSYGTKLDQFADGKELVRLSKPLRDHAEASCDACGSTQPRTLFCLKNIGPVRYFFVGNNCLRELAKRGVVRKRFGKESTPVAYQEEMERRAQERSTEPLLEHDNIAETPGARSKSFTPGALISSASESESSSHYAEVYVIETKDEYHAFISIKCLDSPKCYWGYAMEVKHESALERRGEEGFELDWVNRERPHALEHSLSKAMEEAYTRFQVSRPSIS